MASLTRDLRRELERTVIKARRIGEQGAQKTLESLAVPHHEPWPSMTTVERDLRNRLRAHGRLLGDRRDERRGTQTVNHLIGECAYEHWHRMLFARFLAENNLLIEPDSKVPISLEECRELAMERGTDWLALASDFAIRMLPQIFRKGDPILEVALPPETRHELEGLLKSLPREVFIADDSLGWVYQFWQTERKNEVNDSENKIGADELPAVTQLFTEDYMVLFLLHNTLGAWWTAKRKAEGKDPTLAGYEWTYLRLRADGMPSAGIFDGWPRVARDLRVLDPCMGSGHFLVSALPILVGFRKIEEGLSHKQAVEAVLRDNLFGLELDNRCTQIAAFNLALTAWRMVGGVCELPQLNLACSGLGINAKDEEWLRLGGRDESLRETMEKLYALFRQASVLGSLIDPKRVGGTLFSARFEQVRPLLERALRAEQRDESTGELAVAAEGIIKAAHILGETFTLVATNVPYLGRSKQDEPLRDYCENYHSNAKADLATCFVERCLRFCSNRCTVAIVTPQNWLFLHRYKTLRCDLLKRFQWIGVAWLGPNAFETIGGEVVNVAMLTITAATAQAGHEMMALDCADFPDASAKALALISETPTWPTQQSQLSNPDCRITATRLTNTTLLENFAVSPRGVVNGDQDLWTRCFWEVDHQLPRWRWLQTAVFSTEFYGGREFVIDWSTNGKGMLRPGLGNPAYGKVGVAVSRMSDLPATIFTGELYDQNTAVLVPTSPDLVPALWAFCSSPEFKTAVRAIDRKLGVTPATLLKISFDPPHWKAVVARTLPGGIPKPHSDDPTQWLFHGHPKSSEYPLQVATARLLGFLWPRLAASSFPDCLPVLKDGLEKYTDRDGIVSLSSVKGEAPAADRLRSLLADAYGREWSAAKQAELLSQAGYGGEKLEDWLRDGFFEQHCELFNQRPFIWHIWDGLRDGFSVLVNYHSLVAQNGGGRRTLEKLIYTYLGDWIDRQRADQKNGVEGADGRVAAATHLQSELEKILAGESPYDIFARWKPLQEQPIGWEPDINDGMRINIRPFMTAKVLNGRGRSACILRTAPKIKWDKDRGKDPHRTKEDFPWFWSCDENTVDFSGGREFDGNRWNDLHYTRKFKQAARDRYAADKKRQRG